MSNVIILSEEAKRLIKEIQEVGDFTLTAEEVVEDALLLFHLIESQKKEI